MPDAVISPPPPPQPEQPVYQQVPRSWPVQQDYRSFHRQFAPYRKEFVRSAVYAGIIGAILSALPFVFLFAVPLAGVLSVVFYRKRTAALDVTPSTGLRLGSLAGLCAFGCFLVLLGIETLGLHHTSEFRQAMVDRIHQAQAMNPDPQAQQVFRYFLTPQGMEIMMILGLVFMCIIFVLLAGLGGTVAAFSRRSPPRG